MHAHCCSFPLSALASSSPPEQLLGVLAKSIREVVLLPFLRDLTLALMFLNPARSDDWTYCCLLICLCLKPTSFWLAGLMMASEGLM